MYVSMYMCIYIDILYRAHIRTHRTHVDSYQFDKLSFNRDALATYTA